MVHALVSMAVVTATARFDLALGRSGVCAREAEQRREEEEEEECCEFQPNLMLNLSERGSRFAPIHQQGAT